MVPSESHSEVLDFGRLKVHEATGAVGKVVDEVSPRDPRFSQYRIVLELVDGSRQEFLFLELRDATAAEVAKYQAACGAS